MNLADLLQILTLPVSLLTNQPTSCLESGSRCWRANRKRAKNWINFSMQWTFYFCLMERKTINCPLNSGESQSIWPPFFITMQPWFHLDPLGDYYHILRASCVISSFSLTGFPFVISLISCVKSITTWRVMSLSGANSLPTSLTYFRHSYHLS